MSDDKILRVMRQQAWERAKGELFSMIHTFYPDYRDLNNCKVKSNFKALSVAINDFVEKVEQDGLNE